MMYEDDIKLVDEWFEKHTEYYGTNHEGNEYTVSQYDIEDFSDFLRDTFPDLVYIRCCFGTGDASIWFYKQDLKEAPFY